MSKVFILGAGFSKAVSLSMPTLWELSQKAVKWYDLPIQRPQYLGLSEDVEQLLTYLYQEMPWKSPEEVHLDKAAFLIIAKQISSYIEQCERQAFETTPPSWGKDFAQYLHQNRCIVATLNYDTIVERLAMLIPGPGVHHPHISESDLYQLPISPLLQRTVGVLSGERIETFRLLKLHGSTNWYSSGDDAIAGQQVYYEHMRFLTQPDEMKEYNILNSVNRRDLIPLIVPPVAEKSTFYKTRLIRILWSDFRQAIEDASEIYCVGYSLPKTDLTMNLFLRSTADNQKTVFVVDSATADAAKELKDSYEKIFKGCLVDFRYLGRQNAVQKMVEDLGNSSS